MKRTTSIWAPSQTHDPYGVSESVLGHVQWVDTTTGYCECPGAACHTQKAGQRDCRIALDQVPTIHCFHTSCQAAVDAANHALRSALARGELAQGPTRRAPARTPAELAADKERQGLRALGERARARRPLILQKHQCTPAELRSRSPSPVPDDPAEHWRLHLQLFQPGDVVWIGDTRDSCGADAPPARREQCGRHFRAVADWLTWSRAPGAFTCPSVFTAGSHSRSNANVLQRRFLVVESDVLSKPEICAVFGWCGGVMKLRAVVDTGGKSLHGWFDVPCGAAQTELRVVLPGLGCDPALFKLAQPCRLPGVPRGDRMQELLYLDLGGVA